MIGYEYIDKRGTFRLKNPELSSYLYFPIANESGVMSSVTPTLGGDSKMGQNTFLLSPVSSEDLHNNKSTRNFWCNVKGKVPWSATGRSVAQEGKLFTCDKEETILEAGVMWHKLTRISKEYGLTSEVISFVPSSKETVEIMLVSLKNNSEDIIDVIPTAAIPIYGRSADNIRDHRNVTSMLHRVVTTGNGIVVNPTLTFDERGHRKNTVLYSVFGVEEDYIGEGGSFEHPRAIFEEYSPITEGYEINGYEAMGGIRFKETSIAPSKDKTYIILLGYGSSMDELEEYVNTFSTKEKCLVSLEATKRYWEDKINISYNTGDKNFDSWMHWVNFQPMLRRIYGCSFLPHHDYGRGGRGWRDLWQDCLALLMMNPDGVKDMLISNFGGVRVDGTNATIIGMNQGEFIADRNNITRVWMDHGIWPFLTTRLYIMQSGDLEILLKENYYFKDPQGVRGEEKDLIWGTEEGNRLKTQDGVEYLGSILEHMLIEHLTAFYDVGEHNHIKLRGADWNDALDMAKERGESVAFTSMYGSNLEQMAELILELNKSGITSLNLLEEIELLLEDNIELYDNISMKQMLLHTYCTSCKHKISGKKYTITCSDLANNLKNKASWIREHIRKTEWITNESGHSWYNGYYDNHGRRVEGDNDKGVRMMLTSQVFPIMSNTATIEQVEEIVAACDIYLYDPNVGGYKLNTNFHEVKNDLGRMFGFAYGHKENGAVFSHMAIMYANALYQRGFVAEGYKVISSLYGHCMNFNKSRIYPGIPEYIGSNGRGLYHYLTGSASWLLLTVLTEMFGVKGRLGDLNLSPKLMLEQFDDNLKAEVSLIFAERRITISFVNINDKDYGDYSIGNITVDGDLYKEISEKGIIRREDIKALDELEEHVIVVELM
jgi:cellobiose phosphorylase